MTRLNNVIREEVISSIEKGISINKISVKLNLAKSTIYHYYRKIKGKKYHEPFFESKLTREEGEIVGMFAGDGSFTYYQPNHEYRGYIVTGVKNKGYAKHIQSRLEQFFNKPFPITQSRVDIVKVMLSSKALYVYFHNFLNFVDTYKALTIHLKHTRYPKEFLLGFLTGLLDTDGTVYSKSYPRISFYTSSQELKKQVISILILFGLSTRVNADCRPNRNVPCYNISLRYKEDCQRFASMIDSFKIKKWGCRDSNTGPHAIWVGPRP